MKYFEGVTDLEIAKQRYRELAKQLHPDKGGSVAEFQRMQEDYKLLLIMIQQNHNMVTNKKLSPESELLSELGKLAKVLIKKQVPQEYLCHKIKSADSPLKRRLFEDIVFLMENL